MSSDDSLTKAGVQEIAPPVDRSPLALLSMAIRQNCNEADNAIADILKAVERQAPEMAQISKATNKGFRLVVDASDETLQAIDRGDIKLTTDKMGNTFAQMKRSDGRYGKKLPIKREEFSQGIDPVQAANAMQVKALQEQLDEIAEQITVIDGRVKEVLRGQQNDRIGLFRSGMSLYLEAREVSDEGLRKLLVAQSLRALSDATAQLDLELQEDVAYLSNGEYRKAKGKRGADRREDGLHQPVLPGAAPSLRRPRGDLLRAGRGQGHGLRPRGLLAPNRADGWVARRPACRVRRIG